MKDMLQKLQAFVLQRGRLNYRDRRAHYASGNLMCLRDQYWSLKGEPETNPADFVGSMKMMAGNALEAGLVDHILKSCHYMGYHLRGTQVPVGGSNPDWNGYLDALMDKRNEDGSWEPFVVEIKTKSGYGANFFYDRPEPSPEYMTQLGLYMKDMHEKGITSKGCFLFMLLSDKHFGTLVQINCHYDPASNMAFATDYVATDGSYGTLSVSIDLTKALQRWTFLDNCLKENTEPSAEYKYKYELTADILKDIPDPKLKKIIEGNVIYGDWQPLYSRYKNKQLEVDGIVPERTAEEIAAARAEYRKRHPRSKI